MQGDTIEGPSLAITVAPALRAKMSGGTLDAEALPLTTPSSTRSPTDTALDIPWTASTATA